MRVAIAAALMTLALAAPATAATRTQTFTVGPITVDPYEVKQTEAQVNIPRPQGAGAITAMDVDIVDRNGTPVPIDRLMLHHVVFANVGGAIGERHDATCATFTGLDNRLTIPAIAERFYAAGEERATLALPPGYGYEVGANDVWSLTWMVMNHRAARDTAFIRYHVTWEDDPAAVTGVTPVWLDVANCRADPVYDVPGGGKGADERTSSWRAPAAGRLVAAGGHLHGGGLSLRLTQPGCGERTVVESTPTWGLPSHPFYNVKPVLHEPGPINMSAWRSAQGLPLAAGEALTLRSRYDATRPHTRVMGIMVAYFAPDPAAATDCGALPADQETIATTEPGRRGAPPKVAIPLTALDRRGRAVRIAAPPGRTKRTTARRVAVSVGSRYFGTPNLSVRRGTKVTWRFDGEELHDVTLASGPRGFSSPHLRGGDRFSRRLTVPGTYRLFCSLHPVAMQQRLVVR